MSAADRDDPPPTRREFAQTAEWVGTGPDGMETLIDGRVVWDGAPESFDELATGEFVEQDTGVLARAARAECRGQQG